MTTYYDSSIVLTELKYLAFLLIFMGNGEREVQEAHIWKNILNVT
jgi:hypothetical protein